MGLKHHWKFNNNLQDAVGDLHLTNVVGTPAYTSNKDGVANSCLDNSAAWYAYSDNTTGLSYSQRSYSFWIENPSGNYSDRLQIYQDKMFHIGKSTNSNNITLYYRNNINWSDTSVGLVGSLLGVTGDWIHVCFTINNDGIKKIFINGILKGVITNTIAPTDDVSLSGVLINKLRNWAAFNYNNIKNVDEIKFFDHILTDGGIMTVGEVASLDSEVWQLYLAGVNNLPPYTQNPATDITGTSAKLSWNES
jgi:hypothetical protein